MDRSDEVPGDKIGWYREMPDDVYGNYRPRAFIPVRDRRTVGILLVGWKKCHTYEFDGDKLKLVSESLTWRWCLDKIWIYKPYRRSGIATETVKAAAGFLGVELTDLGILWPVTEEGWALVRSWSGGVIHVSR
ncbi:hypothetical protein HQ563_03305 [bacterium]|nr:hypothetical protein [bacterium]